MAAHAKFLADVTIPDNTAVLCGTGFTKSWMVQNDGTVPWTSGYRLIHYSGTNLAVVAEVPVPPCPPGGQVQISIAMTAPTQPGVYRNDWILRDEQGNTFEDKLYVIIDAKGVSTPVGQKNNAFIGDVTIPDGTAVAPGSRFTKTWRLRNTGTLAWTDRYTMVPIKGNLPSEVPSIAVPPIAPGAEVNLSVNFIVPRNAGNYNASWKMKDENGQFFGTEFWVTIAAGAVAGTGTTTSGSGTTATGSGTAATATGSGAATGSGTATGSGAAASSTTTPAAQPPGVTVNAPHYSQRDPRWGSIPLARIGTAPRISSWGCMMTSFAMLASTMGHVVTPMELNDLMIQRSGFTNGYFTRWDALQVVFGDIRFQNRYLGADALAQIDASLAAGRAVPVQVDITPETAYTDNDQHWVLVVGKNGQDYWMNDPIELQAGAKSLMARYGRRGSGLAGSIVSAIIYVK